MARITHPQLEAFLAFGNASIAICEVKELARRREVGEQARDLLVEISAGHVRLRELFANGLDDAVAVLSRDVMDLVSFLTDVLNQEK
jgi:hypothetical protein